MNLPRTAEPFPLHTALRQPATLRLDELDRLLASHDPNGFDGQGLTPLMVAVSSDRPQSPLPRAVLHRLLEVVDPGRLQGTQGNTALLYAARHGTVPTVQALLPVSDASHRNHLGNDLLYAAALNPHAPGMVAAVLPWSDPHRRYPMNNQQSALMLALQKGTPEAVHALAPLSDMTIVDTNGFTPLALAARESTPPVLLALLEHDVGDEPVTDGWGVLMLALLNGRLVEAEDRRAVIERLLAKGMRTDLVNDEGNTVLSMVLDQWPIDWTLANRLGHAMPLPLAMSALAPHAHTAEATSLITTLVGQEQNRLRAAMQEDSVPHTPPGASAVLTSRNRL